MKSVIKDKGIIRTGASSVIEEVNAKKFSK